MGEIKQTNFRLDEEKVAKFRAFCEEEGYNQAQGFDYLMDILELERAKQIISNRETEISEFEMHTKATMKAFVRSLELCTNAEKRIREEYDNQLRTKDTQISEYQAKIKSINDSLKEATMKGEETIREKKSLENELLEVHKTVKSYKEQIDTYRSSNDALTASLTLANEKAQINAEAAKNYNDVLNRAKTSEQEIRRLTSLVEQIKEKHENELMLLKHDHEANLKEMEAHKQLAIKTAVEETTNEYRKKIDDIKNEYEVKIEKLNEDISRRVDSYQIKLEKSNDKIDSLREKMQAEIEKYKKMYEENL